MVSEALLDEVTRHDAMEMISEPAPLWFDGMGNVADSMYE